MISILEFILADNYQEPNGENYDYFVRLYSEDKEQLVGILEEIKKYIDGIEEYEYDVITYLKVFLGAYEDKIYYSIERIKDLPTIWY